MLPVFNPELSYVLGTFKMLDRIGVDISTRDCSDDTGRPSGLSLTDALNPVLTSVPDDTEVLGVMPEAKLWR